MKILVVFGFVVILYTQAQTPPQKPNPSSQPWTGLPNRTLCQPEHFQTCFANFALFEQFRDIKTVTVEHINDVCRQVQLADICVGTFERHCHTHLSVLWDATDKALQYLCTSVPRNAVIDAIQCAITDKTNLMTCIKATIVHTASYLQGPHTELRKADMCKNMAEQEGCMVDVAKQDCGPKASAVFDTPFTIFLDEMQKGGGCRDTSPEVATDECSGEAVQKCFGGLIKDGTFRGMENMNAATLERTCRDFKATDECIWKFEKTCESDMISSWRSVRASLLYICSQPRDQVLAHMDCMNGHHTDVDACIGKALSHATNVLSNSNLPSPKACAELKAVESCMVDVETRVCSDDAKHFYGQFYARLNENNPLCKPEPVSEPGPRTPDLCSPDHFTRCFSGFLTNGQFVGFSQFTRASLDRTCKLFEESKACVYAFETKCSHLRTTTWNSMRNAFRYICDLPRDDLVKTSQCLSRHSGDLMTCVNNVMTTHAKHLHRTVTNENVPSAQDVCQSIGYLEKCVVQVEADSCGKEAAEIYSKFFTLINDALQKQLCGRRPPPVGETQCTPQAFKKCFGDLVGTDYVFRCPEINAEHIDKTCQKFAKARICIREIEGTCPEDLRVMWASMNDAFQYICTYNRDEINKYMECGHQHQNDLSVCLRDIVESQSAFLLKDTSKMTMVELRADMCAEMLDFEDCVADIRAEDECCREAREMFDQFYHIVTVNTMNQQRCPNIEMHSKQCAPEMFKECFDGASPLEMFFDDSKINSVADVEKYCKRAYESQICVSKFESRCHDDVYNMWQATLVAIEHICDLDHKKVLEVSLCRRKHLGETQKCMYSAAKLQGSILQDGHTGSDQERKTDMCKSVAAMEQCTLKTEASLCGKEAAVTLHKMFKLMDGIIRTNAHCPQPIDVDDEIGCHQNHFQSCFKGNLPHEAMFNNIDIKEQDLDEFCRGMSNMEKCTQKFSSKCAPQINWYIQASMKAMSYLCEHTRRGAVVSAFNCLKHHNKDMGSCMQHSIDKQAHFLTNKSQHHRTQDRQKLMCESIKLGEECTLKVEHEACGKKSAIIFKTYFAIFNKDLSQHVDCDRVEPEIAVCFGPGYCCSRKKVIIISCTVIGTVLLIIILVLCCIKRRHRRNVKNDFSNFDIKCDQMPSNIVEVLEQNEKMRTRIGGKGVVGNVDGKVKGAEATGVKVIRSKEKKPKGKVTRIGEKRVVKLIG